MVGVTIPEIIPAMVLSDVIFFPQSILPIYIFEDHYRKMLEDVIKGDRMFTVINSVPDNLDATPSPSLHESITVGMIKACQTYADGTSTVLLEGFCRLTVQEYLGDAPYLRLRVTAIPEPHVDPATLESLRNQTLQLLEKIHRKGGEISSETLYHLRQICKPQHFVDHAAVSFLKCTEDTQILLNCSDPLQRYSNLLSHLYRHYQHIELINSIIGDLKPEEISRN